MNDVLLMACVGPMQSWGTRSRFEIRDTEREPSKSGIIGILASALGRFREDPLDDLSSLRMGVRVDREGVIKRDFQTVQKVAVASGGTPTNQVSQRYYLSDAAFLVGLEGDGVLINRLQDALKNPKRPLFLGRKSYVPSAPFYLSNGLMKQTTLENALINFPMLPGSMLRQDPNIREVECRFIVESNEKTSEMRKDEPVSFRIDGRRFRDRFVNIFHKTLQVQGGVLCS